jgi:hypothetical protein
LYILYDFKFLILCFHRAPSALDFVLTAYDSAPPFEKAHIRLKLIFPALLINLIPGEEQYDIQRWRLLPFAGV